MKKVISKTTDYILQNKKFLFALFNVVHWLTLFIIFALDSFFNISLASASFWLDYSGMLYLFGHLSILTVPIIIFIDKKSMHLNIKKLTSILFLFFSYLDVLLYIHFLIIIFFDQKIYPLVFFISGIHFSLLAIERVERIVHGKT